MSFNFEAGVVFTVKRDHTSIVFEYAHTPIILAERFPNGLGCCKDRFFEHVVELSFIQWTPRFDTGSPIMDASRQSLVAAVL